MSISAQISAQLSHWSDDDVKKNYRRFYQIVENSDVFNVSDVMMYEMLGRELARRRIAVINRIEFI